MWMQRRKIGHVVVIVCLALVTALSVPSAVIYAAPLSASSSGRTILAGHLVPALRGLTPDSATPATQDLQLSIALRPRNASGLRAAVAAVNDKHSARYHHYLSKGQFTALYAPAQTSVNALTAWLKTSGLTVQRASANRLLVDAQGTVSAIESAFAVQLADYLYQGRLVYAPVTEPSVPNSLAGIVAAVDGLDDVAVYQRQSAQASQSARTAQGKPRPAGTGPLGGFTPNDLRTAYDISPLLAHNTGTNQIVALVELYCRNPSASCAGQMGGYDAADINQYLSAFNLGSPVFQAVPVDNVPTTAGSGASEVELDMEMVAAVAPGATQLVYIGPNDTQGINDTYAQIVAEDLATVVSTSWGECEFNTGAAELATLDTTFQQATLQGQAVFAASGDSGAYGCAVGGVNNSTLNVDSPADDPNVVGVGGTTLDTTSTGAYSNEFAWGCLTCTFNGAYPQGTGGGGGLSTFFNAPAYQNGPGVINSYSNGMREVPDVSANADPSVPYSEYCTVPADAKCNANVGGWVQGNGTSAAAPVWAGVAALVNAYAISQGAPPLGSASADLYTLFNSVQPYPAYHDVTHGYNLNYLATSGYDLATGIGSPDVWNLAQDVAAGLVSEQVSRLWYFAEGYTGTGFTEYLTLANPNAAAAHVTVQYLQGGGAVLTKTYTVAATSRTTITVNNEVGAGKNVSMIVTSDVPIVAERPMYFTYGGISGASIPGGTDVLGATHLDTQYDFAYVDTSTGHDTYFTILNPNSTAMTATIQYTPAAGNTSYTYPATVAANSRGTVRVSQEGAGTSQALPAGAYSAQVTLSAPGLVERPFYELDAVTGRPGATDVVGVAQPLTDWYFAEGYTSPTFDERYILANFGGPQTVILTFTTPSGSSVNYSVTLSAHQQQVVDASAVLGSGATSNSVHVHAASPILAERFMSFDYTGAVGSGSSSNIPGATEALGAAQPSETYYFAEGYTGGSFAEYLTIQNPQAQPANVQVTYLPTNGSAPTEVTYLVPGSSRYTVNTATAMPQQSFSMVVQSTVPIVAERPMYFSYGSAGLTGGSDIIGYVAHPVWSVYPDAHESNFKNALFGSGPNDMWTLTTYGSDYEHWDGTAWTPVSSPGEGFFPSAPSGVAISPADAWAVGSYGASQDGNDTHTFAIHWDGFVWSIVNSPNVPTMYTNQFHGVAAVNSSDVWAVGVYGPQTGAQQTLTEHWDGVQWTIVSSPSVGTGNNNLSAAAAIASNDVWAAGSQVVNTSTGATATLIEYWNGSSWTVVSSPSPGTNGSLSSITAISANDIWAVGQYAGTNGVQQTLALHYDGLNWNVVSTPNGSGAAGSQDDLVSVYARTASDVWAVGYWYNGSSFFGLIEHWDGARWSIIPSPTVDSYLDGVIAFDPANAWVAGGNYIEHYG